MGKPGVSDGQLYGRLLRHARPFWPHLAGLFVLSLLSTPLVLLAPLPLKIAVDSGLGSSPLPAWLKAAAPGVLTGDRSGVLGLAALLLVGIALLTQLQWLANSLLRTYASERMLLEFRGVLFRHVQRLSFSFHDARGVSDSAYRIQYDASALQYIAIDGVIPFITAVITLASMFYVIFRLDWQLAMVALAISPILAVLARTYRIRLRDQARRMKNLESSALAVVPEALGALRLVKAFGQEDREHDRFLGRLRGSLHAKIGYTLSENMMGLLVGLTTGIGTAGVLYLGARHVLAGVLTLGELLLVMGYLAQLFGPLKTISNKFATMQSHLASAERALSLLDEAPDVPERRRAKPLLRARGEIAFRNVSFAYAGEPLVLRDLCFELPAGARVGIVGKTGAGKTTLVSLLTRFYDPVSGQVLLDGVDLRDYRLADLRSQFAIVLQDSILFSTTIAENIAYGRPSATEAEIVEAARAAGADDFITKLPQGYATLVGERGMRLSGGERQRISLARAFLKDAPILILDEPTSAVDTRTESGIMEALHRLCEGRTTFMIAHRLSTLAGCDLIIELGEERSVQIKEHSDLLSGLEVGSAPTP